MSVAVWEVVVIAWQDVYMVFKLLLPTHKKRVYNMKDKQIVKALSSIFSARCDAVSLHLSSSLFISFLLPQRSSPSALRT
jgi:hypothetical protein